MIKSNVTLANDLKSLLTMNTIKVVKSYLVIINLSIIVISIAIISFLFGWHWSILFWLVLIKNITTTLPSSESSESQQMRSNYWSRNYVWDTKVVPFHLPSAYLPSFNCQRYSEREKILSVYFHPHLKLPFYAPSAPTWDSVSK